MGYPEHQLWALALAGVITELDDAHHDALGGWGDSEHTRAWCKTRLANSYGVESTKDLQPVAKGLYQHGHTEDARKLIGSDDDTPRALIVREHREEIEKRGVLAWDTARFVAVMGWSAWAGYVDEMTAWQVLLMAGARAQQTYDSWESFARGYELGRLFCAEGKSHEPTTRAIEKLLSHASSPWKTLPWNFDLGVTILDPNAMPRFKRSICPTCAAPKTRPSSTAYVYCDFCGSLADYNFAQACERSSQQPGPTYETLAAALTPKLEAAHARGDRDAFRATQIELFDAWAIACPYATPVRARDLEYRGKYVAYLAEAAVVSAFDERARELEAAMNKTMTGLRIEKLESGELRVDPTMFRAMFEAVLAREAYVATLHEAHGVYAMHPDGASVELQKRMSLSMFAQGWLPLLDETTAKNMLTRLKLVSDYVEGIPVESDAAQCGVCGVPITIARGAKRMVCEHCGHKLDVDGVRVVCAGCGVLLAPNEGTDAFACPHCKLALRRVTLGRPHVVSP